MLLLVCTWGTAALAQTPANVTVVSGSGQMICQSCINNPIGFFQALVARVTDVNGNPVPASTAVNWAVTAGGSLGMLLTQTSYTDSTGTTMAYFSPTYVAAGGGSFFNAIAQTTITATAGSASAAFYLTQVLADSTGYASYVTVTPNSASAPVYLGAAISGPVGSTYSPPFIINVFVNGQALPNVAVNLFDLQCSSAASCPTGASVGATAQCATGAGAGTNTVLTDATGTATCNPVFGGVPGQSAPNQFYVVVGASYQADPTTSLSLLYPYYSWGPLSVRVTPATPTSVALISGNNQSAQAGQSVALPLVVEVLGSGSVPLAGQTVNWTVSPSSAATLGSTSNTTGNNGQATNTVQLASSASGTVTVTASVAGVTSPVTFTLTAVPNVTVTGLSIVSGNNQAAVVSTAFASPLVVQLTANGGPASGITVQFGVSGPATLSATSATTNSAGQASVTATAGSTAGAVSVTASVGAFSQTFTLTVSPPGPTLTASSFLNGADFQRGALSPCSIATIIAPGIAPTLQGIVSGNNIVGPLPFSLGGDSLTVGTSQAPIFNVGLNASGGQQLTFQVPCDVTPGSSVPVLVNVGAGHGSINIPIQAASPGIFQTSVGMTDGVARAVIVRDANGSYVTFANPARKGESVVAFVTGMGPSNPPVSTDQLPVPGVVATPQYTVVVGVAGQGVASGTAQLSSDLVGVWEVPFTIPATISSTNYPVCGAGNCVSFSISIIPAGSSTPISSGTTTIPVQ